MLVDPYQWELDVLYVYNTTLIKIHSNLVSQILAKYNSDPWWAWSYQQIQSNCDLDANAATLLFVLGFFPATDGDL